ncbi:MAG: hypothetical protein QOJ00_2410 [Actinomycetota bacterium]|jgi:glycosyltransferase involved in cell wall biosynthesis
MRIALYHNLPPGGALRYMREVVARSARDHDYTEFTPSYAEREWALRPLTNAMAVARQERRIAAEIDAGGFDVAFVHGCRVMQAPGVLSMLATPSLYMIQEPRRRTVETGYRPGAQTRTGFARAAWSVGRVGYDTVLGRRDRKAAAAATALACNSLFSAENISRVYGRDAIACYAGVDIERFFPDPSSSPSRSFYLSVGALDASKGHDLAIEAISRLNGTNRLPLVVVGSRSDPEAADALEAQARGAGVDLRVRTSVSDDELVGLYRNAAAALCLARLEPFGLTVHEAVACGTPVVAVREGGFRETLVEGVNGLGAERNATSVADAIARLGTLGLTNDAGALHAQAAQWTWDLTAKRLNELLEAAAATR